jgi:hypothetical protein
VSHRAGWQLAEGTGDPTNKPTNNPSREQTSIPSSKRPTSGRDEQARAICWISRLTGRRRAEGTSKPTINVSGEPSSDATSNPTSNPSSDLTSEPTSNPSVGQAAGYQKERAI